MYSLTSANRYYLYQGFVRMNLGIDGLFKIIRSEMKDLSPVSGDIFLFFGKNRQSVKILRWDGDGFLLYYKRLEGGSFELPTFNPTRPARSSRSTAAGPATDASAQITTEI